MRIVFVNNFARGLGGGEQQLLLVMSGLQRRGLEIDLITSPNSELAHEAQCSGVNVVEANLAFHKSLSAVRLIKYVCDDTTDFVVGSGYWTNLLVGIVSLPFTTKRIALHQSMPDSVTRQPERSIRGLASRFSRVRFHGHIAISNAVKAGLLAEGIPEEIIKVIYNGVDEPHESLPTPLRKNPVIGFLGRLEIVKGCDTFLRVLASVKKKHPTVQGRVAGDGSQRKHLENLRTKLGLHDTCHFVGPQNAYKFLANIDILLMPSRSEAFGLVAVEAQRVGVAVVAFDTGGISETLLSKKTTRLVHPGDISEMISTLTSLVDTLPQLKDALAENAETALNSFLPEESVEHYYDYFQKRCSNSS